MSIFIGHLNVIQCKYYNLTYSGEDFCVSSVQLWCIAIRIMRSPIANSFGAPYTDIFLAILNTITQSDTIYKFDLKQYQLTLVEICFKMALCQMSSIHISFSFAKGLIHVPVLWRVTLVFNELTAPLNQCSEQKRWLHVCEKHLKMMKRQSVHADPSDRLPIHLACCGSAWLSAATLTCCLCSVTAALHW